MGYANIQADSNFYRQSLNADGVKYVTGPYTSLYEDVFRAVTVTTDSVVSVTSYVGDSLSNQFLLAGTEIYGLFSSVTIHSGKAVLHLAGASYISEIINQYSASGIPLGFYEEGTQCLSQKISALLTQGLFDDASWVMVPSQYEEDWVRAFKPTSTLGDLAFTRSSDATFTDSTGVVRRSPWNLAPYSEQFDNAAWSKFSNGTGLVPVVTPNDAIAPNGTLTADKVVLNAGAGTTTSDQSTISWSTTALTGLTVTWSVYLRGSVGGEQILLGQQDGGYAPLITLTTNWKRYSHTAVVGSGSRPFSFGVRQGVYGTINSTATIYAWGAQVVEGTEALPYFATTDRLNVPRLDYRNADGTLSTCPRLLLEPQRTNSIRNSSMVGTVAGSPGTLTTNWTVTNGGLTQTIVGTGIENGLPYIDLRFNGTATGASALVAFEGGSTITAANAQSWTNSFYFKTIAAPNPPVSYNVYSVQRISGSAAGAFQNPFTPTTTLARYSQTFTTNNASVNSVQPYFVAFITIGNSYDFTIRIAAPQMELGAYATTWVPTTTTAVTRIADAASKTGVASLIGQTEGAFYTEIQIGQVTTRAIFSLDIGTTTNYIAATTNATNQVRFVISQASSATVLFTTSALTIGRHKLAFAYKSGDYALYIDGVQAGVSSSTTFPVGTLSQIVLNSASYGQFGDGYAQAVLFPVRLDNATLAALTTL